MEIFDELVESEVSIVTPHLKALVEFCLQVCNTENLWILFNSSAAKLLVVVYDVLCVCIMNSTIIINIINDAIYTKLIADS